MKESCPQKMGKGMMILESREETIGATAQDGRGGPEMILSDCHRFLAPQAGPAVRHARHVHNLCCCLPGKSLLRADRERFALRLEG